VTIFGVDSGHDILSHLTAFQPECAANISILFRLLNYYLRFYSEKKLRIERGDVSLASGGLEDTQHSVHPS
jgi:hypothetical protein